jgi:FkbM family methyltransferase
MFAPARELIKKLFDVFGLELRRKQHKAIPRASMGGAMSQLVSLGFKPLTVVDVGVASETTDLYQQFKDASILLIEPLVEFEPFLRKICNTYSAQYVLAAAGECPGTAVLNVHSDMVGSSCLQEVEGPAVDGSPRVVPVVTIDQLCLERKLRPPYLIKVDVQGAELQVLAGADRTMRETEVVILEVTLFGTFIGGPQFYDVAWKMKQLGFVVYDLFGFLYRPFDDALSQLDVVFVREHGPFRQFHGYATPEQRKSLRSNLAPQLE